jgi:PTH1 family peptidyl-tRNA hydrolase
MAPALLIVGLGNPGKEYEGTRHSVGRDVLAALARSGELIVDSGEWRERNTLHAETFESDIAGHRVILARPMTYMNESGTAAAALVRNYQLSTINSQLLIIHDDLDLPIGTLRLSVNGSSGGQKGVQSIIDTLGTKDFLRLRIGIGPNETPDGHRIPAEHFVLAKFRPEERPKIDTAIARAIQTIDILLRDGLPAAQQFANGSIG